MLQTLLDCCRTTERHQSAPCNRRIVGVERKRGEPFTPWITPLAEHLKMPFESLAAGRCGDGLFQIAGVHRLRV